MKHRTRFAGCAVFAPRGLAVRFVRRGAALLAGRAGLAADANQAKANGQGQVGDSDLAGRRAVAPGFVRSQAGRGQRLLRTAEQPDCDQRGRHPHRRAAPFAGEAGRQVSRSSAA